VSKVGSENGSNCHCAGTTKDAVKARAPAQGEQGAWASVQAWKKSGRAIPTLEILAVV